MMPGLIGRIGAGVVGGLVGGAAFGVLMQTTDAIPAVASLVDQESIAVGWAVHMGIAVVAGAGFALAFGYFSESLAISMPLGAFYGIIWWVLGGLTLMPMRLGQGLFEFDTTAWESLAGHVAYGVALAMVYSVTCYVLARRAARSAAAPPAGATVAGAGAAGAGAAGWPPDSSPGGAATPRRPAPPDFLPPAGQPRPEFPPPAGQPALDFLPPAEPARPAAPPPPVEQAPDFLPSGGATPQSARPRGGLTPLPPQARALRQRRPER